MNNILLRRRKGLTEREIPNNEILYISSDGVIVVPYSISAFNVNIISNTYSGGKGIILFDGDVTSIGNEAFKQCSTLVDITFPNSLTSIGLYAFYQCESLTNVIIPESVTNVGRDAFNNCTNLVTLNYNAIDAYFESYYSFESGTMLGPFSLSPSIISVNIGDTVTAIPYTFICKCKNVISITIPSTVTNIKDGAFALCRSLSTFNYLGIMSQWNSITKGSGWNYNTVFTVVHCSDGDVEV